MERLTRRINGVVVYVGAKNPYSTGQIPCEVEPAGVREMMDCLAAYEDTRLSPEKVSWMKEVVEAAFDNDTSRIERAHNLHVADKEGRVIVLPCKVGDMLYEVTGRKTISVYKVKAIRVELFEIFVEWNIVDGIVWQSLNGIGSGEIGKTVFLSHEEAKKALAEMEGKKDD